MFTLWALPIQDRKDDNFEVLNSVAVGISEEKRGKSGKGKVLLEKYY